MIPNFTVVIGSANRPSLIHTLRSFRRQNLVPGDQIIVCLDGMGMSNIDQYNFASSIRMFNMRSGEWPGRDEEYFVPAVYDAGYHWYGVEQINYILRTIPLTGSHILTLGDDDVLVDGALDILRAICQQDLSIPILYRFLAPWRAILWDFPRMQMSKISGCCIAAPRADVGMFPTRRYVEHDYDWMMDILRHSLRAPIWLDEVLVIARPEPRGDGDVTHRPLWRDKGGGWKFGEDIDADSDDGQRPGANHG